jgi:hypothetical protein
MQKLSFSVLLIVIAGITFNNTAMCDDYPRSSIRFNLGVWDIPDTDLGITVYHTDLSDYERLTEVNVSGISYGISFSQMVGNRFAWELSTGGVSDSQGKNWSEEIKIRHGDDYYETTFSESHNVSVVYMMIGIIYYPFSELDQFESSILGDLSSFIRPYITAGIGPYFGLETRLSEDDVTDANFASTMGAYPGVGLDLLVSKHFILNFDLRYHFVEFGEPLKEITDFSGVNALFGFKIAF